MLKKLSAVLMVTAIMVAANANVLARTNGGEDDKKSAKAAQAAPAKPTEEKNWRQIFAANREKPFDPASRKSTLAEHQAQQKAGKKFSTTTKVLIGVGIAAAVLAVVFVVARDDLKDDILK
jgi:ferric-dicitrate binding protein FerR (iron transport regulator)